MNHDFVSLHRPHWRDMKVDGTCYLVRVQQPITDLIDERRLAGQTRSHTEDPLRRGVPDAAPIHFVVERHDTVIERLDVSIQPCNFHRSPLKIGCTDGAVFVDKVDCVLTDVHALPNEFDGIAHRHIRVVELSGDVVQLRLFTDLIRINRIANGFHENGRRQGYTPHLER